MATKINKQIPKTIEIVKKAIKCKNSRSIKLPGVDKSKFKSIFEKEK